MMLSKNSRGVIAVSAQAAERAAFLRAVTLLGVPFCRPPRRSPGFEPRAISYFYYLCYSMAIYRGFYLCYSMAIYRGFGLELKILFIYQSGRCLECRKAQE